MKHKRVFFSFIKEVITAKFTRLLPKALGHKAHIKTVLIDKYAFTKYDHTIMLEKIKKSLVEIDPVVLEKKRKSFNIINYIYTILLLEKKMNQLYQWMIC